jgi:hypothetical protein
VPTTNKTMAAMVNGLQRYTAEQTNTQYISHRNITPDVRGEGTRRTFLADLCNTGRTAWVLGSGAHTLTAVSEITGLTVKISAETEEAEEWRSAEGKNAKQFRQQLQEDETERIETDWIISMRAEEIEADRQTYIEIIKKGISKSARGIIMLWADGNSTSKDAEIWQDHLDQALNGETNKEWSCKTGTLQNERVGGAIEHVI